MTTSNQAPSDPSTGNGMPSAFDTLASMAERLQPDPERPGDFVAGDPQWTFAALTEGRIESGLWTSGIGTWDETDYPVDEVMVITGGHLRLTETDGTVHDLVEGHMFFLPKGWSGRWEVKEPLTKIYVVIDD